MNSPEFSFPASNLDAAGKHFHLPVRAGWLRGVLEGTAIGPSERDGELDVRLSKSGTDVVVRGTLAADLVVPCSRCLAPAMVPIREELSILAVPSGPAPRARGERGRASGARKTADDDPGEADVIAFDGENVVLDDLVRDELLLGHSDDPLVFRGMPRYQA